MSDSGKSDAAELDAISLFKKGYNEVIEAQTNLVRSTQQLLGSNLASADDRSRLQEARTTIDKALGEMQKQARQLSSDLNPGNLEKDSIREYHNIFSGEVTDHRVSFIRFLKTYVALKRYALETSQQWGEIQSAVQAAGLAEKSELRYQLITYHARPGIQSCENIQTFCNRMGRILRLKRDPLSSRSLDGAAVYSPDIEYTLSFVFTTELDTQLEFLFGSHLPDADQLPESVFDQQPRRKTAASVAEPARPVLDHKLDASGSTDWNRTPHYFFHYDPRALEEERARYADVIYMDTHMGADQQYIKSDLIINISRKSRLTDKKDIEAEYLGFLHAFFNMVIQISQMNMSIDPRLGMLFIYHMGPATFYSLTIKFLQDLKTGTFHKRASGGAMIKKYIPMELIKKAIVDFWRSDILPPTEKERDDYGLYKRIAMRVKETHARLTKKALLEYENVPADVKRQKSREQIMRENIAEWMGSTNIVIFKRFLKAK